MIRPLSNICMGSILYLRGVRYFWRSIPDTQKVDTCLLSEKQPTPHCQTKDKQSQSKVEKWPLHSQKAQKWPSYVCDWLLPWSCTCSCLNIIAAKTITSIYGFLPYSQQRLVHSLLLRVQNYKLLQEQIILRASDKHWEAATTSQPL